MTRRINRDDIDKFFDCDIHLPTRTVWVGSNCYVDGEESGTDWQMAERLTKSLWLLDHASSDPITIIMNNFGGDEFHMFAMYDAIQACKSHVTMIGTGAVMSAGSLVFQAADDRVLRPNAYLMIHYGTWGVHDHPKIARAWTKAGVEMDKKIAGMYLDKIRMKKPAYTFEDVDRLLDFDTILTADAAVELGLADRVEG